MLPRLAVLGDVGSPMEVFLCQIWLHRTLIVLLSLHLLKELAVGRLLSQEAIRLVEPLLICLAVRQ